MKKTSLFFDDLLKITGVTTVIIIVAGFFDLKTYYGKFGIPINDYISTSEILLLSVDKLLLVLFSLIVQIILWLYFFNDLFNYEAETDIAKKQSRPESDTTIDRFVTHKGVKMYGAILISCTIIVSIFYSYFPNSSFWVFARDFTIVNFWIAMCLYMALLQSTKNLWDTLKKKKDYNAKFVLAFIVFLITFFAAIWVKNNFRFLRVRKYGNKESIEIRTLENEIFIPTDTIRYVGKTEKYYFYWNKTNWQTTVVPADEVKKIVIKTNLLD